MASPLREQDTVGVINERSLKLVATKANIQQESKQEKETERLLHLLREEFSYTTTNMDQEFEGCANVSSQTTSV